MNKMTLPHSKNQGCTRSLQPCLHINSDNFVTALSSHCDNLVFETVTTLSTTWSQPGCDKIKVQLLIWHMWVGYAYSRNAVNNHTSCSFSDNLPVEVNIMTYVYVRICTIE